MFNRTFGEFIFDIGWKTQKEISLFGTTFKILVKAKAYFEKDGITPEQENAFEQYISNESAMLETVEGLLNEYADGDASERFIPRILLFERDGGYALLLDDEEDEDDGVAVSLEPEAIVYSQDEYL